MISAITNRVNMRVLHIRTIGRRERDASSIKRGKVSLGPGARLWSGFVVIIPAPLRVRLGFAIIFSEPRDIMKKGRTTTLILLAPGSA
jgi:hypothetical protein